MISLASSRHLFSLSAYFFKFIELFCCILFKVFEFFDEAYGCDFKFCVLGFIQIIFIEEYFYSTG